MRTACTGARDERGSIIIAIMVIFVATGSSSGSIALVYNEHERVTPRPATPRTRCSSPTRP